MLNTEVHQLVDMAPVAGPRVNRHMREVRLDELRGLERGVDIVDGEHESARLAGLGRFQNGKPGCIAKIALVAELIDELNLIGIVVEGGEGNSLRIENAAHHL